MARARAARLYVDGDARSTLGNVAAAAALARELDAKVVLLVTSSWHARRAGALLRAVLAGSGRSVVVTTTDEPASRATRLRELVCLLGVPLAALRRG